MFDSQCRRPTLLENCKMSGNLAEVSLSQSGIHNGNRPRSDAIISVFPTRGEVFEIPPPVLQEGKKVTAIYSSTTGDAHV